MPILPRLRHRLHPDHLRVLKGASRVAFFLLLGKAMGAFKEMAVAYRYGVSAAVDAYQFTMTMATWLPVTLVGVLSVVLIPVLVQGRRGSLEERRLFIREMSGWGAMLGLILAALTWVLWPWVMSVAGQGLSASTRALSEDLIVGFAPIAALTVWSGLSAARLRAYERHVNTLLDGVPAMLLLACVLILAPAVDDVRPLMWGSLLGFILQAVWLSWLATRADGVRALPLLGRSSPRWHGIMEAAGVMLVGQVAMSFVGPIDQYTAANLGQNANATLGYAARLLALILGIGAVSVGRAALPVLADIQNRGDGAQARTMALKWSLAMIAAGLVAVLLGWLLAPWGVRLLFERGAFTAEDTVIVTEVFRWGLLQLPFYFGVLVLVQLLASQRRYRIMAAIAVANFAVKAVMNTVLAPVMGVAGIMLATVMMYASSFTCYAIVAWRSSPSSGTAGQAGPPRSRP
ncbi:murein biosynthesis integral membrane protein MurJ [Kerstersia gyiorum]|uniref:Membrane protein n=1 Tax=Kerstersia gyiorum TaxID=206506 RepID=A0A171KW61_9BURK|nr:membrane protein [Kerstersia gyiorum]